MMWRFYHMRLNDWRPPILLSCRLDRQYRNKDLSSFGFSNAARLICSFMITEEVSTHRFVAGGQPRGKIHTMSCRLDRQPSTEDFRSFDFSTKRIEGSCSSLFRPKESAPNNALKADCNTTGSQNKVARCSRPGAPLYETRQFSGGIVKRCET